MQQDRLNSAFARLVPMTAETTPLNASPETTRFQTGQVVPVITTHLIHDMYTSSVSPLLPLIIEKLSLTLTQAGLLTSCLQIPGILNPLFGYIADKVSVRYFLILAPAITGTAISLIGLAPNAYALAILLLVAGTSTAAFHAPAPALIGRVSGRQVGLGMSLFMAGGELAYTIGPLLAVWAVTTWTLEGFWRTMVMGWAASFILFLRLRNVSAHSEKSGSLRAILPGLVTLFLPVALFNLFRYPLMEGLTTFLPTYMTTRGASLWMAGGSLSIIMSAGVLGVLSIGTVSDRLGRKTVLIGVTLISAALALAFLYTTGWVSVIVLFTLGFFVMSTTPVMLAMVQEQFPQNRATANGIYMATNFVLRPVGTVIVGFMGDHLGLQQAILWGALASLLCILPILKLPDRHA
jgi:FSR family fosmidomycin resistance protein-like MFS transporter